MRNISCIISFVFFRQLVLNFLACCILNVGPLFLLHLCEVMAQKMGAFIEVPLIFFVEFPRFLPPGCKQPRQRFVPVRQFESTWYFAVQWQWIFFCSSTALLTKNLFFVPFHSQLFFKKIWLRIFHAGDSITPSSSFSPQTSVVRKRIINNCCLASKPAKKSLFFKASRPVLEILREREAADGSKLSCGNNSVLSKLRKEAKW